MAAERRLWIAAAVLAVLVGALGLFAVREVEQRVERLLERSREAENRIAREIDELERIQIGLALRAHGFMPWSVAEPPAAPPDCARVLFVAHIYPKNGAVEARYPDPDRALASFLHAQAALAPQRVYFGGDTVEQPVPAQIELVRSLQRQLPHARFVIGNHEQWWSDAAKPLRELLGARHGREDVGPARVVWLHSVKADGSYGVDAEESEFLARALADPGSDYRVVLMHHALWAGDTWTVNKDYEDAPAARTDWMTRVLPQLAAGGVKLVLLGDAGVRQPGTLTTLHGIPHATTGWSAWAKHHPPEWVGVDLCPEGPRVTRFAAFAGELWMRREWPRSGESR